MRSLMDPRDIIGALEIVASIVLLWAMQKVTTVAGLRSTAARWALFRRFIYCEMAVAMFGLGAEHFLGDAYRNVNMIALFQGMVVFGVMIFPLLRATGWISQDFLISVENDHFHRRGSIRQYDESPIGKERRGRSF